jgi:SAM-dependent methyltransferase
VPVAVTGFDESERRIRAGQAAAYAGTFAKLCAYPVSELLDAAEVGPGVRMLDVGTGPGTVAIAACARGATVTAVDAEPSMVVLARQAGAAAEIHVAAVPELPFSEGKFDAVVGNFVLNHVGRPRAALAELRRVVRAEPDSPDARQDQAPFREVQPGVRRYGRHADAAARSLVGPRSSLIRAASRPPVSPALAGVMSALRVSLTAPPLPSTGRS